MDTANKKLKKQNNSDANIRISQHSLLTKNFLDLMMEYKNLQELYQGKYKDRMQRQALIGILKRNNGSQSKRNNGRGGEAS
jgi:syntaxin 1A/syntaxin 1B/2/3